MPLHTHPPVVAHDHMRQNVYASIYARFSMVCTTIDRFKTGGAHNGASRLAAVRREASPLESAATTGRDALRDGPMCDAKLVLWSHRPLRSLKIGHYGMVREGTGLGPVPGVNYSATSRYRKVTTCSRVQVSEGLNLSGSVPTVMPFSTAHRTAL